MNDLPSPREMELLAILVRHGRCSGREVAKRYQEETKSSISYGTLYTTFRRLKESGWVDVADDTDQDGRVRYFTITGAGVRALSGARERCLGLAEFLNPQPRWRPACS